MSSFCTTVIENLLKYNFEIFHLWRGQKMLQMQWKTSFLLHSIRLMFLIFNHEKYHFLLEPLSHVLYWEATWQSYNFELQVIFIPSDVQKENNNLPLHIFAYSYCFHPNFVFMNAWSDHSSALERKIWDKEALQRKGVP